MLLSTAAASRCCWVIADSSVEFDMAPCNYRWRNAALAVPSASTMLALTHQCG